MHSEYNHFDSGQEYRTKALECSRILLEGGADYSILGNLGCERWWSGFEYVIRMCSVVSKCI